MFLGLNRSNISAGSNLEFKNKAGTVQLKKLEWA